MHLVELEAPKGKVYINPKHIIWVAPKAKKTDVTVLCYGAGLAVQIEVSGNVDSVVAAINDAMQ